MKTYIFHKSILPKFICDSQCLPSDDSRVLCTNTDIWITGNYVSVKSKLQHPPRAYPGHLTLFLAREGGNLISTHRGWGIWLLASMPCYERNPCGDVTLCHQRKRLRICGGLVENQRPTQALFRIWRCLRMIYIIYLWIYLYSIYSIVFTIQTIIWYNTDVVWYDL